MQLGDRGNYYCRDTKSIASFSIWVTTLQGRSLSFFIYDYEIISERKCKIHVPLLFLELMTSFKEMPTDSVCEHLIFIEVDDL